MVWLILILAGLFEVAWSIGLKYTDGFTRPLPSLLTAAAIVGSMTLLSLSTRTLPLGTAYAIWVGVGVVGATVGGVILFGEAISRPRLFFLLLLIGSIVGLKLTSSPEVEGQTVSDSRDVDDGRVNGG